MAANAMYANLGDDETTMAAAANSEPAARSATPPAAEEAAPAAPEAADDGLTPRGPPPPSQSQAVTDEAAAEGGLEGAGEGGGRPPLPSYDDIAAAELDEQQARLERQLTRQVQPPPYAQKPGEQLERLSTTAKRLSLDHDMLDALEVPPSVDQPRRPSKKAPDLPHIERRNYLLHQHFIRNEMDSCKALIQEQVNETKGTCEYALYLRGVILRQEGKIQESLDVFQECAALNPQQQSYVKQIGRSLFLLGKHKAAIDVFDEALKLGANDWEIYHWKGMCYYQKNDFGNAKRNLIDAFGIRKHEKTFELLGKIATEEGDLMTAIEAYRKALEVAPENCDLQTKLGLLYLRTGSERQAFEALGRALSSDPSHPGAILAAGAMMQQHGDYDVALTKYRVAAQQIPDCAQLWANVGMCFYGKRKLMAAVSCLKRANYLAPFDWRILYNLGLVHLGMQQHASAFHFLSAAINIQPKSAQLFGTLAVVLTHLDDHKNAAQAYERAVALDDRDPMIALNFAIFHSRRGNYDAARLWLGRYDTRFANLADPTAIPIGERQEMQESAEKLRNLSQGKADSVPAGAPMLTAPSENGSSAAEGRRSRPTTTEGEGAAAAAALLASGAAGDPFAHEEVAVPPPPTTTADSTGSHDDDAALRQDRIIEDEYRQRVETESLRSVNSRFPPEDGSSNI